MIKKWSLWFVFVFVLPHILDCEISHSSSLVTWLDCLLCLRSCSHGAGKNGWGGGWDGGGFKEDSEDSLRTNKL